MKDTDGYISAINQLKQKYKDKIEIYLGVEEDAFNPLDRSRFDYIIGSSHYYHVNDEYLPIDSSPAHFKRCLETFNFDITRMAETYYSCFCDYILKRKPDIIGHYDLITKYDEINDIKFSKNKEHNAIAEKYLKEIIKTDCIFEVNTGAITRGIRSTVYPAENLLHLLKKENAKIMLSSDSHQIETLNGCFEETKKYLINLGFTKVYTISKGKFVPVNLK
jgi:histidinol-phosphatase (PHP family)